MTSLEGKGASIFFYVFSKQSLVNQFISSSVRGFLRSLYDNGTLIYGHSHQKVVETLHARINSLNNSSMPSLLPALIIFIIFVTAMPEKCDNYSSVLVRMISCDLNKTDKDKS